jgi:(1->4)-alpha-D-glucan 1-alpha-D-glucosylmutase
VRTRLDVLSEIPSEWAEQVRRWLRLNASRKREVEDRPAPEPVHEYLLYQTLVGSWPEELMAQAPPAPALAGPGGATHAAALAVYRERVEGYLVKALREAKTRSSWRHPNEPYEQACLEFLGRLLDADSQHPFLGEMAAFSARVAGLARPATLAQAALKLTVPGVPDLYQGCELADLALADPDNRRPVDFARRQQMLERMLAPEDGEGAAPRFDAWSIDELKLLVTARLLRLRRERAALFRDGGYLPLEAHGEESERIVAFARHLGDEAVIVVVPRLCAALVDDASRLPPRAWGDTAVRLPTAWRGSAWRDAVTGRAVRLPAVRGEAALPLGLLYERLPLAVLVGEPGPCGSRERER